MIVLEFSPWSAGQKTSVDSDERLPLLSQSNSLPSCPSLTWSLNAIYIWFAPAFIISYFKCLGSSYLIFFPFSTEHQAQSLVHARHALNLTQSHMLSMSGLVTYLGSMTRCLTESNLREGKIILMCSLRMQSPLCSERPGRSIQVIFSSQWILKHRNESWNSPRCLFSPAVFILEP